jgi:hypothetical protein
VAIELAHPFRFTGAGDVATVDPASDAFAVQSIVLIAGTVPGERVLVPGFGLADPTFGDGLVDAVGLNSQLELYGPSGVTVGEPIVDLDSDRTASVTLEFSNGADEEAPADAGS